MEKLASKYPHYDPLISDVQTLSEHTKKNLIAELCTNSKYTMEGLDMFIQSCSYTQTFTMKSVVFHIIDTSENIVDQRQLIKVCKRIQCILDAFNDQSTIEFFLVPFLSKRRFPTEEPFHPSHINGAYTYPSLRKVFIYRYEDYPKVALHEACHNLPMHCHSWNKDALQKIYEFFQIDYTGCPHNCSTNILPNEAIVETWAEVLHCKLLSLEYKVPFKKLYEMEREYAMSKALQLLEYQKAKYPLWREKTHAFSYVVIRLVLFWFWPQFSKLTFPYDTVKVTEFIIQHFNKLPLHVYKQATSRGMTMTKTGNF
jgi:hypothetical protein